jgi:hypothetical protein
MSRGLVIAQTGYRQSAPQQVNEPYQSKQKDFVPCPIAFASFSNKKVTQFKTN